MNPFFSIIIPCYNVEPYVRACFDSVLNQSFQDWECLVGVETSNDDTEKIVREYAARDPRLKVFTGPCSGSCSASRNTGTDMATGEYIIFLDGDDTITEGSLQRLHEKITARPDADLYPCAIQVHNNITGKHEELRDNYPDNFGDELTGVEATIYLDRRWRHSFPCPMLQMTVFRRKFLIENELKCIYGLRMQDSEFSPRALYLAKRVIPIHEPFYIYNIRENSVQTKAKTPGHFYTDLAIRLHSLMAFHATESSKPGFDRRIGNAWSRRWINTLLTRWFNAKITKELQRTERLQSLKIIFPEGFDDFDALLEFTPAVQHIAAALVKSFLLHPSMRLPVELFFKFIYFPVLSHLA